MQRQNSSQRPDCLWGLPSGLSIGFQGIFLWELRRSKREADHLPSPKVEAKMRGALPPLCFHCMMLHRKDNFTFTLQFISLIRVSTDVISTKVLGL
jgi:hypothetical protein